MNGRAILMHGPRELELRELPVPEDPPPGGAIMKVVANGICGSDWDLYSGSLTKPRDRTIPFPVIPGHEPVGRIVAIAPDAQERWGVDVGDRIAVESRIRCGECRDCQAGHGPRCEASTSYSLLPLDEPPGLWGGMADYMALKARSSVFKVRDHISDEDAALFNPLGNSMQWTIEVGRAVVGERVLVLGCGQRGLAATVAAAEAGAAQVIVTGLSRDAHKLALAPEFGASATLNVDEVNTVDAVKELTSGHGVDLVIDTVPEAWHPISDAFRALRVGGRLILSGVRGSNPVDLPLDLVRSRQLEVIGVSSTTKWSVENALRIIAEGKYPFHKLHSHTFGLDQTEDAIRTLGGELPGEPIHITIKP